MMVNRLSLASSVAAPDLQRKRSSPSDVIDTRGELPKCAGIRSVEHAFIVRTPRDGGQKDELARVCRQSLTRIGWVAGMETSAHSRLGGSWLARFGRSESTIISTQPTQ